MKFGIAAAQFVAVVAFASGAFFIFEGPGTNLSFLASSSCAGMGCNQNYESLVFDLIGILLVYLSLPIALYPLEEGRISKYLLSRDKASKEDTSLLGNKKISGIMLLVAGSIQLFCASIGLNSFSSTILCSVYGCPSIFNVTFLWNWIFVSIGVVLLLAGLVLIILSKAPSSKSESEELDAVVREM